MKNLHLSIMVILLGRKLEAVNIGSKNCFGFCCAINIRMKTVAR